MNAPAARDPLPARKSRWYRAGAIVAGLGAFVISLLGVWRSLPPHDIVPISDAIAIEAVQPAFTPFAAPRPLVNVTFEDGEGRQRSLADFRGKIVLLNLWATWCGPCRQEMPTLDRLQSQLGGPDFEVVALSIDRDGATVVRKFFNETRVQALNVYVDPTAAAQSKLEILGVPTTLLIDRQGREVARHIGVAEWDRPEIVATIKRYLSAPR